jgi:hypothetical protein
MKLNNSAEIAAFQDGVTSPTAFVMDGAEFVMVPLPRPWPRDGNTVLCTSPHELDAQGAIILPIPMPTKAEVEKWRGFLKDKASKDPSRKYYPPYPTREEIEDWRALSKDRSYPTEERQQFARMADELEAELKRVAYTAAPHDFASWSQEKKNQWSANASAALDELNKPRGNGTPPENVAPGEPIGREDISPEFSEDRLALGTAFGTRSLEQMARMDRHTLGDRKHTPCVSHGPQNLPRSRVRMQQTSRVQSNRKSQNRRRRRDTGPLGQAYRRNRQSMGCGPVTSEYAKNEHQAFNRSRTPQQSIGLLHKNNRRSGGPGTHAVPDVAFVS